MISVIAKVPKNRAAPVTPAKVGLATRAPAVLPTKVMAMPDMMAWVVRPIKASAVPAMQEKAVPTIRPIKVARTALRSVMTSG